MKIVANLKDKMIENKESQWVKKAIRNLDNMLILMLLTLNIISGKLKMKRFKIPNYAYLSRQTAQMVRSPHRLIGEYHYGAGAAFR